MKGTINQKKFMLTQLERNTEGDVQLFGGYVIKYQKGKTGRQNS